MMRGLEIGRIQVAARALGVGRAALEDSLRYAQQRESFGKPIWQHQSVGNLPRRHGDQAGRRPPARPARRAACTTPASGPTWRPAWRSCSPRRPRCRSRWTRSGCTAATATRTEFDVERYFRDAPLMIVGEGTNEIQRNVIARQLVARHPVARVRPAARGERRSAGRDHRRRAGAGGRGAVRHPPAGRPRRPGDQDRAPGGGDFARGYDGPCTASPATSSGSTAARRASTLDLKRPGDRARARRAAGDAPTCSCRTSRPARPTRLGLGAGDLRRGTPG